MARTRKPRRKTSHASAVAFFAKNAGVAYTPGKETKRQGQMRGARELARAEAEAASRGWRVKWEHDSEPYDMGDMETEHPKEVLGAILVDESGRQLASLWGIADPSRNYGRVVEAELALEALGRGE